MIVSNSARITKHFKTIKGRSASSHQSRCGRGAVAGRSQGSRRTVTGQSDNKQIIKHKFIGVYNIMIPNTVIYNIIPRG